MLSPGYKATSNSLESVVTGGVDRPRVETTRSMDQATAKVSYSNDRSVSHKGIFFLVLLSRVARPNGTWLEDMSHNAMMGARAQAPHCSNLGCSTFYVCRARVIPRIHDIMLVLLSKNNCLRTCAPCLPAYGLSEAVRRYSSPRSCLCPIHPRYRLAHRDSVMVYTYQRRRWK